MVRVGVDENLAQELLVDFPRGGDCANPRNPSGVLMSTSGLFRSL
jgi:hypothetical protein